MKVTPLEIPDVLLIEPRVFGDARGFFYESYNEKAFAEATGLAVDFVQDNHSKSARGVLRGLHYQILQPQGKLVRVVRGAVFDVAVDLRRDVGHVRSVGRRGTERPDASAALGARRFWPRLPGAGGRH